MAGGINVQSSMAYVQGRHSVFSKTVDSSTEVVSAKNRSASTSKCEVGQQQQADGGSRDVGATPDVHAASSSVKVQAPASQSTCVTPVPPHTKSNSPAVLHGSSQGAVKFTLCC